MSLAFSCWTAGESASQLDELFGVHVRVGGPLRGRRYATRELNAVIVAQVAAHFQRFCRDLHSEAGNALVSAAPPAYRTALEQWYSGRRALDRGNAWPNQIEDDFKKLDLDIWLAAAGVDRRTSARKARLEQLMTWRNAIAHQDFKFSPEQQKTLAGSDLTLAWARRWRGACHGLAAVFEGTVADHVERVTGSRPW